MRAVLLAAAGMLGVLIGGATVSQAQTGVNRVPPRIIITPRQPGATPYPLPGAAYPGPGYLRDCVAWLEQDPRPSGTVIVPRQSCRWVRGRA
jgi:hypothetical protein